MGNLDATVSVPLHIINPLSEKTIVQVDIPHLNKRIEVAIPNNIQVGHRIRLKGLGYGTNPSGDLIIEISKITIESNLKTESEIKYFMQKIVVVEFNNFNEVNNYLGNGWKVIDFKPFKDNPSIYVYVLLEKIK